MSEEVQTRRISNKALYAREFYDLAAGPTSIDKLGSTDREYEDVREAVSKPNCVEVDWAGNIYLNKGNVPCHCCSLINNCPVPLALVSNENRILTAVPGTRYAKRA